MMMEQNYVATYTYRYAIDISTVYYIGCILYTDYI